MLGADQRNECARQGARQENDRLSCAPRDAWKLDDPRQVDGYRHEGQADKSPRGASRGYEKF